MAKDSTDLKQAMFAAGDAVIGAAVLVGLGVWIGNMLDSKLHTSPWCVVALSLIGAAAGLWRMVRKAMQMGKQEGDSPDPLESSTGSTSGEDRQSTPPPRIRNETEQKPREMKDTKARSAYEFLDQGDSK